MKCTICRHGKTKHGKVTVTLERNGSTVVIKGVPADVCANCGEEYVDQKTAASLFKTAEAAVKSGVQIDVRTYRAA